MQWGREQAQEAVPGTQAPNTGRKSQKIRKRSNWQLHGRHDEERTNRMFVIRKKGKLECEMENRGLKDVCKPYLKINQSRMRQANRH
jgi:hypothetical protein